MKRIILFFTVCLGLSVSQTTFADDANAVRVANKRTTTTQNISNRSVASTNKRNDNATNASKNQRATKSQPRTTSRTTDTTGSATPTVKPRETPVTTTSTRTPTTTRATTSRSVTSRQNESKNSSTATRSAATQTRIKRITRATEINNEKIKNIKSLDYSKCKTVYYECMDEFCANKDANLRRCACSTRIHEFDDIKKQLNDAEDKMLTFNQRLLTVGLDKEDAAAINVATDGELGFSKQDTSESEKMLKKITNALNDSGNSKINNDLSAISLSLDMDTAWDSVDSLSGISTSAKSGLDLYNAAQPICVEMAREVCSDDELKIARDGYKLTIQQDCDTVAKSYKTQYSNAMEKIHESSALLDMSRLNVYQQRNSDDTLTCKKKILNQLSSPSVCGESLYKCLDTSGQYIDPSNGNAFLSENLYELSNLLQQPSSGERWSKIQKNENFVNFLNSKKKFLEPATAQCQNIADVVWQDFLDDALAQIKLAQNAKLEEIRQSCTTLVAECKTNALQSLAEFDARALSTFGIAADKTANQMCSEIETGCAGLMPYKGEWASGMTGIAADISYQKVIETCTTIGRDCIIQQCNGTSGNFALCQKATDDNRRAILNRTVCWNDVLNCVRDADNLENMTISDIYPTSSANTYWAKGPTSQDLCTANDKACYIAKQIWGTCEYASNAYSITTGNTSNNLVTHNKILTPNTGTSLLAWFATNTGTTNNNDSCNSNGCPINYEMVNGTCQKIFATVTTSDCESATSANNIINVTATLTNHCASGVQDMYGNCCVNGAKSNGVCVPSSNHQAARLWNMQCTSADGYFCPAIGNMKLYCVTNSQDEQPITYYTNTSEYECTGTSSMWIIVDENGNYYNADTGVTAINRVTMSYNQPWGQCPTQTNTNNNPVVITTPIVSCTYSYDTGNARWDWSPATCSNVISEYPTTNELLIRYGN